MKTETKLDSAFKEFVSFSSPIGVNEAHAIGMFVSFIEREYKVCITKKEKSKLTESEISKAHKKLQKTKSWVNTSRMIHI